MKEVKIKHRRGELTLTEKDLVMYNGKCYQLVTQKYMSGWFEVAYELSKTTCQRLIKQGVLIPANINRANVTYYRIGAMTVAP